MKILRFAVENERWDLAAHTIVLGAARILNNNGVRPLSEAKHGGSGVSPASHPLSEGESEAP